MIQLLPYEKRLAEILGVSQEEYQQWKAITLKHSVEKPAQGPVCGPLVPILINVAIAVGVTLLSSLLFPAQQQSRINTKRTRGESRTSNQRLSPRFGFDSVQEPAQVGQFVPVVIAKRENNLGGVRVAMPLLWSQMLAWNGSLMFRGIFLAGTAKMAANAWDPRGWAFGNNTLGSYSYTGASITSGARYSIYFSPDGGRITTDDLIAGRQADRDIGNFSNYGAQDVFAVGVAPYEYKQAFCMTETPSTSAAFGLYGWCPNAMMHRATATIQPTITARISSSDKVRTDDDAAALVELWKGKIYWSMRSGLRYLNDTEPASDDFDIATRDVNVGDSLKYVLSNSSDANTVIKISSRNSQINSSDAEYEEKMGGVASSVASVQNAADSSLVPNELYRIGSCWAVLEDRISEKSNESVFISDSEQEPVGNGNTMEYVFTVVRPGKVQFVGPGFLNPPSLSTQEGNTIYPRKYDPDRDFAAVPSGTEGKYKVCSQAAQIFRMAIASVAAVREFKACEIIVNSKVGINIGGMTSFKSMETIEKINAKAGQSQVGKKANGVLSVSRYDSSGSIFTTKTRRYSSFILQHSDDRGASWQDFPKVFAIAGVSGEDVYNYLRINFSGYKRWQIRLVPISSWEIRQSEISQILVLDASGSRGVAATSGGITITTTGYTINPLKSNTRRISQLEPDRDIGLGFADEEYSSMFDGYARFAEAFAYDNLQTSIGASAEHRISQINYFDNLDAVPSYQSLSLVGTNISASLEFSNLQSFSGFCNNGYEMPRLLDNDTKGASHLFPDWLRDLMTNPDLGAMPRTQLVQIDRPSFQAAAQWCQNRNYFYDTVEAEPLNILDWATETAQSHLLKLVQSGGVYYLKKAIEFDNPIQIKAQFNSGNHEEGSFKLNSIDYATRQPFIVQVKWREESAGLEAPLFARERVATVRRSATSANAPVKTLDLSKWCTNYKQAIDAACYYERFVTIHDHRIAFNTSPDILASELSSGDFFRLDLDVINYNSAVQGFIQEDGTIVTTRPDLLPAGNGSYPGLTWDMESDPEKRDIVIVDGLASPTRSFFAIARATTRQRVYEITKIDIDNEGVISIEALHHPVNENGMSELGVNWTTYQTDENWIIDL